MQKLFAGLLMASVCALSVHADDKAKTKDVEIKKEERIVIKKDSRKKEYGSKFTRFWTKDVGETIFKGLKKGSSKIANTFD
jgi:hypothetical protein